MPLAAGGMARIYIGRSTGIGSFERHVVLKMITPERANDLTAVNMFLDEARLAASLNHQNVAQVFEVGEESGIHYLAMEYVHGQDLRAVLAKAGSQGTRIPLELALTVVAGAAAGLHHAHERRGPDGTPLGIVHRDVSPSNIMIGYDGAVKLLDFGIAKATSRSVETQSGIIKGKFAYMAPEQCRGREVDKRSDVFSLGIILYEISTQHRCFRADSDFDTMHRIVTGDVVRPTRLVQGYPQALEAIVMKALAVDPAQRYQSSGLLLEALESFAVSARMSLSTMGLGRFMRDMFGEVQEPWLNTAATKVLQPLAAKENTISSTNGKGTASNPALDTLGPAGAGMINAGGIPDDEAAFPDSAKAEAAKTILDLPRDHERNERQEDSAVDPWNAKSYPAPQPSIASHGTMPPDALARPVYPGGALPPGVLADARPSTPPPLPPPITPPVGVQQMGPAAMGTTPPASLPLPPPTPPVIMGAPPSGQFSAAPGSGSGPAIPAMGMPSTKHGYASGAMTRGDVSYPRYDVSPVDQMPADMLQLTPNRKPLFIGIGIVVAGLVIIAIVAFSGGGNDEKPAPAPQQDEPAQQMTEEKTPAADQQPQSAKVDDVADDSMISVIIHSDPPGADVLIAGTKIGITPFESKLKRGTKIAQLTVQKTGYGPWNGKIDLGGEYENRNIKLIRLEDMQKDGSATVPDPSEMHGPDDKSPKGTGTTKPGTTEKSTTKSGTEKASTKTGTEKSTTKSGTEKSGTEKSSTKTGTEKSGTEKASTKSGTEKSGTEKSGTTTKKKEPCQQPGPNLDPFGPPVCKT
jgi:serine/threonine-protein kinase